MPELPEVEVVRRRLTEVVIGRGITEVRVSGVNYAFLTAPGRLKRVLLGRVIRSIDRHGKYLMFALDDESRLVVHLGMTGQLFTSWAMSPRLYHGKARTTPSRRGEFDPDEHTHLSLTLTNGEGRLHYRDARKFGKILWLPKGKTDARLERLGVDALGISCEVLRGALCTRRASIKSVLLDQTVLAGVGNIYADESLFLARIAPTRAAFSLTERETQALVKSIRAVLRRAIERGGSTIDDYIHPDGSEGAFQRSFAVYGREGQPCRRCKTPVVRTVIGQRSAHYCARCQG